MKISVGMRPKWTDELGNPITTEMVPEGEMGDRFYQQQLKATGSAVGSKSKPAKAGKPSKAELVAQLPDIAGLDKLVMSDLEQLITYFQGTRLLSHFKPEDKVRLKAPWIQALTDVTGLTIDWNKLTVATMKELYAHITGPLDD